jgi:hypothetical protein
MDVEAVRRRWVAFWPELVVVSAIVLGWGVRIQQFLVRRSLWVDEALLARNIVERDFAGLLEPLGGNQGAPPGFLWLEKLALLAGGRNEYALRFVPLVAGLALLPLTWLLARRLLDRPASAVATVLVSVSPALVRYATEVKQYGVDATVAVGLVILAVGVSRERARSLRVVVVLSAAGAAAVWLSHPSAFILAGCGSVLLVDAARRRDTYVLAVVGAMAGVWALSFGALYMVSLRRLAENEALVDYWSAGFVPRPIGFGSSASWLWSATADYIDVTGGFATAIPVVAAAIVGTALVAARRRVREALLLWAAIPFLLVAAAAERYPFRGRLALFLLPLLLIALSGIAVVPAPGWRLTGIAIVALLTLAPAAETIRLAADPPLFAHSRPVFEYVRDHRAPDDAVYVHGVTAGPYHFYGPILGLDADARTEWLPLSACPPSPEPSPLARPLDGSRVWVVFAYTLSFRPQDEVDILRSHFDAVARRVSTFSTVDASATLYDFGAEPSGPVGVGVRRTNDLGCLTVHPL